MNEKIPEAANTSHLAKMSFALGLASFLCLPIIPAILCGMIALVQIRFSKGRLTGSRWALAGILIPLALVVFSAAYVCLIPGLGWYHDRALTKSATGTSFSLGRPIASYDSERAFNGDGYSIAAYRIPEPTLTKFRNTELPAGPSSGMRDDDWVTVPWRLAPTSTEDQPYLDFALSDGSDEASKLALNALKSGDALYSYIYFSRIIDDFGLWIGDVDFFVLDLKNGLFIVVNHNT